MLELLKERRSIRKYENKVIEEDKKKKLIHSVLLSPSSRGKNPWEFIVIEKKEVLLDLSKAKKSGSAFLKDAQLAFVVIADESLTDVWIEDTSIASIIIQLTAQSLELGSCWIQIRNRMHDDKMTADGYIKKLLGIPQRFQVESVIAIGYPDEKKNLRKENELSYEKIHNDHYGR